MQNKLRERNIVYCTDRITVLKFPDDLNLTSTSTWVPLWQLLLLAAYDARYDERGPVMKRCSQRCYCLRSQRLRCSCTVVVFTWMFERAIDLNALKTCKTQNASSLVAQQCHTMLLFLLVARNRMMQHSKVQWHRSHNADAPV